MNIGVALQTVSPGVINKYTTSQIFFLSRYSLAIREYPIGHFVKSLFLTVCCQQKRTRFHGDAVCCQRKPSTTSWVKRRASGF